MSFQASLFQMAEPTEENLQKKIRHKGSPCARQLPFHVVQCLDDIRSQEQYQPEILKSVSITTRKLNCGDRKTDADLDVCKFLKPL